MGNVHKMSRRVTLQGLLAVGALSGLGGTGALAEDVIFGAYDEFTVYHHEEGPLKDNILFLFHGFGSAMPNGAYYAFHDTFAAKYSVVGFNYDYFDLDANDRAMERVWEEVLKGRNVTFGGTSLGGFWANFYAEKYGIPRLIDRKSVV